MISTIDLLGRPQSEIDWTAVTQRIQSHPEEAKTNGGHGTILHTIVTKQPPLEVLHAVIRADHYALWREHTHRINESGLLESQDGIPLALACHRGASLDAIKVLLQATVSGLLPLTLHVLLVKCRFWEPSFTLTNLGAFLEELPPSDGTRFWLVEQIVNHPIQQDSDYWEKINLLFKVATIGSVDENEFQERQLLFLHKFLEIVSGVGNQRSRDYLGRNMDRVIEILNLIKEHAPEQFRLRDMEGRLPLHIAIKNTHVVNRQEWRTYPSKLIKFLLQEYPESAGIPDQEEARLPLHIAVEHGLPCFSIIAKAEPRALMTRCPVTQMYPFQLAVLGLSQRESSPRESSLHISVENTFKLLRLCPEVAGLVSVSDD